MLHPDLAQKSPLSNVKMVGNNSLLPASDKNEPNDENCASVRVSEGFSTDDNNVPVQKNISNEQLNELETIKNPSHQSYSSILPITIPHGFQLQRTLSHIKASVRMVVWTPPPIPLDQDGNAITYNGTLDTDAFVSMDTKNLHFWRGQNRVKKYPLGLIKEYIRSDLLPVNEDGKGLGGTVDHITHCAYVRKFKLFIVATDRLELKILDFNLVELARKSCEKPVLTLEVVEAKCELIVGCIGGVWIWEIRRESECIDNRTIYTLHGPRLVLQDFKEGEWVARILYRSYLNRIYVACDNSVYIFDHSTGTKIDHLENLHELSITQMVIHERSDYLITGAKDGQSTHIYFGSLVCSFYVQGTSITGLALPLEHTTLAHPPLILLSSTMGGSLHLWDIDKVQCIYRQSTQSTILGLAMIRRDVFFHYTTQEICVWHLNRIVSTFSHTQSPVTHIQRVLGPFIGAQQLSRLVVVCEDGSVRLISPRTRTVLVTCFPTFHQAYIFDVVHDIESGVVFTLMNLGEIIVYNASVNPAKVSKVVPMLTNSDVGQVICITALSNPFFIMGGTSSGQIVLVNLGNGQHQPIVQGHAGAVTCINAQNQLIMTASNDKTIKTWRCDVNGKSLDLINVITCTAIPVRLRLGMKQDCSQQQSLRTKCMLANDKCSLSIHNALSTAGAYSRTEQQFLVHISAAPFHQSPSQGVLMEAKIENQQVWLHSIDEDHQDTVTAIDYLETLDIYASAGLDGVIKVWSSSNVLIREVHVGEPVRSVAFANLRGDLLIGVGDEISILNWRDYLPSGPAQAIQNMEIPEDPYEDPVPFDPQLDFWDGFKDQPGFQDSQWKMSKLNIKPNPVYFESELLKLFQHDLVNGPLQKSKNLVHVQINTPNDPNPISPHKPIPKRNEFEIKPLNHNEHSYNIRRSRNQTRTLDNNNDELMSVEVVDSEMDKLLQEMSQKTYEMLACSDLDTQLWDQFDSMMTNTNAQRATQTKYMIRNKQVPPPPPPPPTVNSLNIPEKPSLAVSLHQLKIAQIELKSKQFANQLKLNNNRDPTNAYSKPLMMFANSGVRGDKSRVQHHQTEPIDSFASPVGRNAKYLLMKNRMMAGTNRTNPTIPDNKPNAVNDPIKRGEKGLYKGANQMLLDLGLDDEDLPSTESLVIANDSIPVDVPDLDDNADLFVPQFALPPPPAQLIANKPAPVILPPKQTIPMSDPVPKSIVPAKKDPPTVPYILPPSENTSKIPKPIAAVKPQKPAQRINPIPKLKPIQTKKTHGKVIVPPKLKIVRKPTIASIQTNIKKDQSDKVQDKPEHTLPIPREEDVAVWNIFKKSFAQPVLSKPIQAPIPSEDEGDVEQVSGISLGDNDHVHPEIMVVIEPEKYPVMQPDMVQVTQQAIVPVIQPEMGQCVQQSELVTDVQLEQVIGKHPEPRKANELELPDLTRKAMTHIEIPISTQPIKLPNDIVPIKELCLNVKSASSQSPVNTFNSIRPASPSLVSYTSIPQLNKIVSLDWFPGLQGKPVNVSNVIAVLSDLVRSGGGSSLYTSTTLDSDCRLKATQMLVYVYRVFSRDIRDPMTSIVHPILDAIGDLSFEGSNTLLRLSMMSVLPNLGMYYPTILHALVEYLQDPDSQVRALAMEQLSTQFGIRSKAELVHAMVRTGLKSAYKVTGPSVRSTAISKPSSILDELYQQYCLCKQKEHSLSVNKVSQWLKGTQVRYTDRLVASD